MPELDYQALAQQAGAVSSSPPPSAGVDYDALAKQAGAVSSQPAPVSPAAPQREYPDMAGKPPGFLEKLMAPIREGAIGRAFGLDTLTEAAKQRDPSLQDNSIVRVGEALPHPDQPGPLHALTSFATGMTTPENALVMAGTGGLGAIETAIGKQGLAKLISLGFSAQMIADGIASGPQFAKQVRARDWAGAGETLTRVGLEGVMAAKGVQHARTPYVVNAPPLKPSETLPTPEQADAQATANARVIVANAPSAVPPAPPPAAPAPPPEPEGESEIEEYVRRGPGTPPAPPAPAGPPAPITALKPPRQPFRRKIEETPNATTVVEPGANPPQHQKEVSQKPNTQTEGAPVGPVSVAQPGAAEPAAAKPPAEPHTAAQPSAHEVADKTAQSVAEKPQPESQIKRGEEIRASEEEEAFHRAQIRATGGQAITESVAARYLASASPIARAAIILREQNPHVRSRAQILGEFANILREGPSSWRRLGLSNAQAEHAWYQYGKLLSEHYGEQGREILNYGHPLHAEASERIRRESHGSPPRDLPPDRGERGGGEPDYRPAVRGGITGRSRGIPSDVPGIHGPEVRPGSLFDADTERQSQVDAQRGKEKLLGDQLTAQVRSGLAARPTNLKPAENRGLFDEEGPEQQNFFSSESGSAPPDVLGVGKFIEEDVAPTVGKAARGLVEAADDILKVLAPQLRSPQAKAAGLILRARNAELARKGDQAMAALRDAKRFFDKQPREENYEFIRRVEAGEKQKTPALDTIAGVLRKMLDAQRREVQALGTGKLQKFYENYFPHLWEDPKRAAQAFASLLGRRPLEGGKSFLKQRTHLTFEDGLKAGLKPLTDNPVDLTLLKMREIDRYVMAHRVLNEWKGEKLARFVDARNSEMQQGLRRGGWRQIMDPIGTVYGPSVQPITEYPNEGIWRGVQSVADALGLKQDRGFLNLRGAVGRAQRGTGKVSTLHGTAEDVLAHEIGHQIDWLAGSGKRFVVEYPDAATVQRLRGARATLADKQSTPDARKAAREDLASLKPAIARRKEFAKQLRDLADLRGGEKSYVRKREEKMAQLAEMWVGSRELFARTAPDVYAEWKKFLDENPKLHALRDIEGNTEVTPIAQPYDVGGLVVKGHWWAPDGAARILDNYLSPGLRSKSGAYRALLGANNVLNQAQLGLSAFHLGFTSADAAVSKGALAIEQLVRGSPLQALKTAAGVPAAPVTTWLTGNRLLKEWQSAGSQSPEIAAITDALVKGGGRAHMDEMYQTHMGENMMKAFRNGNILGGLVRAPLAGMEGLSNIIMKQIVPRQKLGVFADLARFELARLGQDATTAQVRDSMAKIWDSVENRLGEMTYDNLFWDRTAKDVAMLTVRSVGWNLGTIREIGGAGIDTVKIPLQLARGKQKLEDVNLHRLAYVTSLAITGAVMGAIYQRLATGKGPDDLKDYYFPKTGQLDEAGRPQRVSMPTYVKDVYHYATEPGKTLADKASPLVTLTAEMVRNKDFYGTEIRNEDDPLIEQMLDSLKHVGAAAEPFGIRNLERETQLGAPTAQRVQQFVGITPAPAALEKTHAELLAGELAHGNIPPGSHTKAEVARRDEEHVIGRLARSGRPIGAEIQKALRAGTVTVPEVRRAISESRMDPLARTFKGLQLDQALKVFAAATPEERQRLRPLLLQKGKSLATKPPAERAILLPKFVSALRGQ